MITGCSSPSRVTTSAPINTSASAVNTFGSRSSCAYARNFEDSIGLSTCDIAIPTAVPSRCLFETRSFHCFHQELAGLLGRIVWIFDVRIKLDGQPALITTGGDGFERGREVDRAVPRNQMP